MENRRSAKRIPVDIYLNKFIGGVPYLARASDISEDGIYLTQLIEPEDDQKRIGVQFQLPGSNEIIYAEGEIMREGTRGQATGHGIRFTLLAQRHRRMIESFVASHQARAA